jgi:hypothetical protein
MWRERQTLHFGVSLDIFSRIIPKRCHPKSVQRNVRRKTRRASPLSRRVLTIPFDPHCFLKKCRFGAHK